MNGTKENILLTALELFSRSGYEAVSVSDIAGRLGMTKSALYKHYKNKRDIFDSITARMEQRDAERSRLFELPEEAMTEGGEDYSAASLRQLIEFSKAQLRYWTEDEFASAFRRLLTLAIPRRRDAGNVSAISCGRAARVCCGSSERSRSAERRA